MSAIRPRKDPLFRRWLHSPLFWYAAIWVLGFGLYAGTATYGFVWDDLPNFVENPALKSWQDVPGLFTSARAYSNSRFHAGTWYRPAAALSWLVDVQLFGKESALYHLENALLHAFVSVIVLGLMLEALPEGRESMHPGATGARWPAWLPLAAAWFAAAVWSAHPAQTEAVAWIKSRPELLCGGFYFAALLLLMRAIRQGRLRAHAIAAVCLLYVLSLFSKEMAVSFPAVAGLCWLWSRKDRQMRAALTPRFVLLGALLVALTGGFMVLRTAVLGQVQQTDYIAGGFVPMMATMSLGMMRYFQLTVWPIWPVHLSADYSMFPISSGFAELRVIASSLAVAAVLAAGGVLWWRGSIAGLGIALYFVTFLPVLNIVPTVQVVADRFLYIPLAGYSFVILSVVLQAVELRRQSLRTAVAAACFVYLALLCASTQWRLPVWRNELALFKDTLEQDPGWRPATNYVKALVGAGRFGEALATAERYARVFPGASQLEAERGFLLLKLRREAEGVAALKRSVELDPGDAWPWLILAMNARSKGDHCAAREYFLKAAETAAPPRADILVFLADTDIRLGRLDEAEQALAKARALGLPDRDLKTVEDELVKARCRSASEEMRR